MQAVHRIIYDAPEFIAVPPEFRHQAIELIIKPLADTETLEDEKPVFQIADVDHVVVPSREEKNVRR